MRKASFILVFCFLIKANHLTGQCLESNYLWQRMIALADSKTLTPSEQLKELLNYENSQMNCPNPNDSTHAFLLSRIGSTYSRLGEFLKAVEYCRRSIHMISAHSGDPAIRARDIITGYYWLSVFYDSLNNVAGKLKAWDSCEYYAIKLKAEDEFSYIRILYSRVMFCFDVGDYHNCIYYANRCKMLASKYASGVGNKGFVWTGTQFAESSLGWAVNALLIIKEYDSAENLLINKLKGYKKANYKDYLGFYYGLLAEVQEHKGNYNKALDYFNKALLCYRETGNHFDCKQILKHIGEKVYFEHFNDKQKALSYYRDALQIVNKDQDISRLDIAESLSIFTDIADVYVYYGRYDSAFAYFQLAFDQIRQGINETGLLLMPAEKIREFKKIHYVTRLVIDKGDAYMHVYKSSRNPDALQEAIRIYKEADHLLDLVRMEQSDLNSKLFWRDNTRRLYEHAIEACLQKGDMGNAFYFFERSRAALLNEQLNQQHWLDEEDISRLTQIRKKILQLNGELSRNGRTASQLEEIRTDLFNNKRELEELEQLIKSQNPLYYRSFLDKSEIGIKDVRKNLLKDHQAILELFTGDSANYSLVITRKELRLGRIDKPAFDNALSQFMNYISNPDLLTGKFEAFVSVSHQLYGLIFQKNPPPPGRIIFSPGDRYFPLEALVTSEPKEKLSYFQNDYAVSYTYSVRFLTGDFGKDAGTGPRDFMGVAPIYYRTASYSLSELNGSDQSLNQIGSHFNSKYNLIGNEASRNNFLQSFSNYRIIQIYTHSADNSDKGEPVMYFSDSALYLSELIPLNKPVTRLIVLSACETGSGKVYKGEGIFSFNRGFAALGIPTAITNIWSVDDQATYQLSQLFYRWLAKGLPTDVALQKAKLEFFQTGSKERQLPYYWAAAIVVGKTDSILMENAFPWKTVALLTVFAGFSLLQLFNWRSRRRKRG